MVYLSLQYLFSLLIFPSLFHSEFVCFISYRINMIILLKRLMLFLSLYPSLCLCACVLSAAVSMQSPGITDNWYMDIYIMTREVVSFFVCVIIINTLARVVSIVTTQFSSLISDLFSLFHFRKKELSTTKKDRVNHCLTICENIVAQSLR